MKNKVYKALAAAFAMALVVASPVTSITCHASGWGFNEDAHDDTERGEIPDGYWDWVNDNGSSDSGSSYEEPAAPKVEYTAPSDSGSNTGSGASYNEASSSNNGTSGTAVATSGKAVAATGNTAKKTANNVTVNVTGGQKFRIVTNADYMAYQVYHCGISQASFAVTDADGNAVAFSSVKLEKGEDGLWYLNIAFAEGVDTKDFTVTVTKGDASYLATKLGVSGIKINGTVALSTVPATDTK